MMLMTRPRITGEVDLVFILTQDDLDQVGNHEPISVNWRDLPAEINHRRCNRVTVAFATAEELKQIELMRLADAVNWQLNVLNLLSRGKQSRFEAEQTQTVCG